MPALPFRTRHSKPPYISRPTIANPLPYGYSPVGRNATRVRGYALWRAVCSVVTHGDSGNQPCYCRHEGTRTQVVSTHWTIPAVTVSGNIIHTTRRGQVIAYQHGSVHGFSDPRPENSTLDWSLCHRALSYGHLTYSSILDSCSAQSKRRTL